MKKTLAALLSAVVLLAALAGCGTKQSYNYASGGSAYASYGNAYASWGNASPGSARG